ncbi:signal peptidase I [Streptomyces sp. NPDC092296]|uniref:signal peptidase I n=1 Tax=Streptomyces sp. NPDC092296 TaxID=3366012 RepID=UPI0038113F56
MSTQEPLADRDGVSGPHDGVEAPARSAAVPVDPDATPEPAGPEPAGPEEAAPELAAPELAGPEPAGPEPADPDSAAPEAGRPRRGRGLLLPVVLSLLLLALVNTYAAQPFAIPSESMENTLRVGDRVVVNKLVYRFGGRVHRGDVVVFDGRGSFTRDDSSGPTGFGDALRGLGSYLGLATAGHDDYVKRVVGVGGDRVICCDSRHRITVNGVPLDESEYLFPGDTASSVPFDIEVPAGELWMMGDHRSASQDSRGHLGDPGGGFVPESKVIGRADWIVYPVGHWRHLVRPGVYGAVDAAAGRSGRDGEQG